MVTLKYKIYEILVCILTENTFRSPKSVQILHSAGTQATPDAAEGRVHHTLGYRTAISYENAQRDCLTRRMQAYGRLHFPS
jgi:hypothetical protein